MYVGSVHQGYPAPVRGINQSADEPHLSPEFCRDARNVYREGSIVRERGGTVKVNSSAANGGAAVLSQFDFQRSDGTRQHLVQAGDTIYRRVNDAITTVVRTGVADYVPMRYSQGLDIVLMSNGVDFLGYWDGTTFRELTDAPVFREILYYNEHWFGAINSLLRNSRARDYETWDGADVYNIESGDRHTIKGLIREGEWVSAAKDNSRTRIKGFEFNQSSSAYDAYSIPAVHGIGSKSPLAARSEPFPLLIDEKGPMALLDPSGGWTNLVQNLDRFWERVNLNGLGNSVSAYWPSRRQLWITLPIEGEVIPNVVLVYDVLIGGVWIYEYPYAIRSLAVVQDANQQERMYIGDDSGFLYEADIGDDDDGSAIDSWFETVDLDPAGGFFSRLGKVRARVKNVGTHRLSLRMQSDSDRVNDRDITSQPMTRVAAGDYLPVSWRVAMAGEKFRIRFRNSNANEPWAIYDYALMGRGVGTSK